MSFDREYEPLTAGQLIVLLGNREADRPVFAEFGDETAEVIGIAFPDGTRQVTLLTARHD